jgi:hypothetical protein
MVPASGGNLDEARATLERAVTMDSTDELAAENLRICRTHHGMRKASRVTHRRHGT